MLFSSYSSLKVMCVSYNSNLKVFDIHKVYIRTVKMIILRIRSIKNEDILMVIIPKTIIRVMLTIITGRFRRFSTRVWQNTSINTVRHAMCILLFVTFDNFIKGIMRIYIVFLKKRKSNVFILHILTCSNIYNL